MCMILTTTEQHRYTNKPLPTPLLLTIPLCPLSNDYFLQERPIQAHPKGNAQALHATPSAPRPTRRQQRQHSSTPPDSARHHDSSEPINIEPSAENIMQSDTEDSSTDSNRARKRRMETKKLLKELQRGQKTVTQYYQQQAAHDKVTDTSSKNKAPQRSRSKSPLQVNTSRRARSRSPSPSSYPKQRRRSRSPLRPDQHSRGPPSSSHEERHSRRNTAARHSPPSSHKTSRSPPRQTPFTSPPNLYAKDYNTTAQDRKHNNR